ncbi:MAG: c-type cytochrome [Betaproteobacteria bacterium]
MPLPRARAAVLRAAASLMLLGAAAASGQTPVAAGGTLAAPAPARAAQCGACHGADGNSKLALSPSLAGQPRVFLENTLIMIREGLRPIAAMKGLLEGVGDAEIVALADHYSRLPARADPGPRDEAAWRRGEALASRNLCGTCHLPSYAGQQQMPRLAGQRQDYLAQSMREFRDNRTQGRDTQMNGVLRGYSDRDIDDLAHYFAQLR